MPGYWVSDSYSNIPVWNVTELEKRGIKNFNPNSWWDFADPKIAPLTCFSNIVLSNADASWAIGMRKTVGDEWFIKIGKGKPGLYARSQQGEVWVGSGEYPICLSLRIKNAQTLVEGGAFRVGWLWPKEGQVLFPFAPVIFSNAPHPNTVNFLLITLGVQQERTGQPKAV